VGGAGEAAGTGYRFLDDPGVKTRRRGIPRRPGCRAEFAVLPFIFIFVGIVQLTFATK